MLHTAHKHVKFDIVLMTGTLEGRNLAYTLFLSLLDCLGRFSLNP